MNNRRWTSEEDQILVQLIQEHPHNKTNAFRLASVRLNRTEGACLFRWYGVLSNPESSRYVGTAFLVISRKSKLDNRTCYIDDRNTIHPNKSGLTIWNKIMRLFKRK